MSDKLKAVPGMDDLLPEDVPLWHRLEASARQVFSNYGFSEIRTPIIEDTRLFTRGIGTETQVVTKEMYTFTDKGGDSVTMRPECTASVVRAYIEHSLHAKDAITKLYYAGPMFRYERPQKGRLRQFHQIGAETFGTTSPQADAELVIMLDRLVRGLGITRYELQINSLGTAEERKPFLEKLIAHLNALKDKLCAECQQRLIKNPMRVFDCKNPACQAHYEKAPKLLDALGDASKAHFDAFCNGLKEANVAFVINPRIVRGLDYYVQTAFEFTSDQLGSQSAFAGGGRYDKLVEELGGPATPAVGFAIGCERLVMLLKALQGEQGETAPTLSGLYLAPMMEAGIPEARKLVQEARDAGIKAEMDFESKSLKAQMRRANKLGFRYVGILGEDELKGGTIMLKDLQAGEQKPVARAELIKFLSR